MRPLTPIPHYSEYTIKWTTLAWEESQAKSLRRRVFCEEQSLFREDDSDAIDDTAQLLVAVGSIAGMPEEIVGTVRIHQESPGTWFGSRLAVDQPYRGQRQLVAGLIQLAVSSAHGLGCKQFFAHVQHQNRRLFERLHWEVRDQLTLHGQPHWLMQADLEHYAPCHTPCSGKVIRGHLRPDARELAPDFFYQRLPPTIPGKGMARPALQPTQ